MGSCRPGPGAMGASWANTGESARERNTAEHSGRPSAALRHGQMKSCSATVPHAASAHLHHWAAHLEHLWRQGAAVCGTGRVSAQAQAQQLLLLPWTAAGSCPSSKGQPTACWHCRLWYAARPCGHTCTSCTAEPGPALPSQGQQAAKGRGPPARGRGPPARGRGALKGRQKCTHLLLLRPHSSCPLIPSPHPGRHPAAREWCRAAQPVGRCGPSTATGTSGVGCTPTAATSISPWQRLRQRQHIGSEMQNVMRG